jgi:hypothetical protein
MVPIQGVLKDTSHNLSALVEYGCSDALYDDRFSLAVWSELRIIFCSVLELLASCCMVVMYMVVSVVKVVVVNVPFVLVVLGRVVHFHRTQLTRADIAVEVALLSAIMLVVQYRTRMVAAWCRFERALEKRSRTAARVAPTVTFFSLAAAFSVLGRNFLDPLVAPSVLPLFTLVVPVLMGGHFLHGLASLQREDSLPAGTRQLTVVQMTVQLTLWLILACYHGTATFCAALPLIERLNASLDWVRRFALVLLICILVSPDRATQLYDTAAPLARELSSQMPVPVLTSPMAKAHGARSSKTGGKKGKVATSSTSSSSSASASGRPILRDVSQVLSIMASPFMYVISSSGLLTAQQEEMVVALAQDGVVLALSVLSCVLPRFLAIFGLIAVAFVVPAFKTAELQGALGALVEEEARPVGRRGRRTGTGASAAGDKSRGWVTGLVKMFSPGGGSDRDKDEEDAVAQRVVLEAQVRRWLSYWVLWSVVWAMRTYTVAAGGGGPYIFVMLLASIFLQHSYFCGAEMVLEGIEGVYRSLCARSDAVFKSSSEQRWRDELAGRARGSYRGIMNEGADMEMESPSAGGVPAGENGDEEYVHVPNVASDHGNDNDDDDDDDDYNTSMDSPALIPASAMGTPEVRTPTPTTPSSTLRRRRSARKSS